MMLRSIAVTVSLLLLAGCAQSFGPSSSDYGPVQAKPGEAVVVAGFDLMGGGPGLNDLGGEEPGDFRLGFHAYDPATDTFVNPPRAFYLEQSCDGGGPGVRACVADARHVAVAVPPGDYVLAFVSKDFWGYIPPNMWSAGRYGMKSALLPAVDLTNTNNIHGSYAPAPGASLVGSTAPRFHVQAGETLYIGFLVLRGATLERTSSVGNGRIDYGLSQPDVLVESRPELARAALEKAGLPATAMLERLAAATP